MTSGHVSSCGCKRKKFSIKDDFFEKIDTEEKAYILGFISSDGYINRKLNHIKVDLKYIDKDILLKIKDAMEYTGEIKEYSYRNKVSNYEYENKICRLIICNKKLVDSLYEYGVVQCKSNTIGFPFNKIETELYRHYIRGYFDGDGSISIYKEKNNSLSLNITSSDKMCCDIKNILENIFVGVKIYKYHRKESNKNNSTIIISNKKYVTDIMNWMYNKSNIYLDRKYHKYQEIKNLEAQTTTSVSDR